MLFHLGSLWRLCELGVLPKVKRISSVSGGSITSGVLALNWDKLKAANFASGEFGKLVAEPIRELAERTIDEASIFGGVFLPGTVADRIIAAYEKHLFGQKTLQDLPDEPRFVFNATNVQTGSLWRFMKPYMGDYRVGLFDKPDVRIAHAVAASSAFPPFLSPVDLEPHRASFRATKGADRTSAPFTSHVILTDGGVYDNLGLETVWKRYKAVLVSDGGGKSGDEGEPKRDWARHAVRVFEITDNQVRSMRKKQVIGSILDKVRTGAYWGIRDDVMLHQQGAPVGLAARCPNANTMQLALTATRLKRLEDDVQKRIINWGYAVCDASVGRWFGEEAKVQGFILQPATTFPYDEVGV